MRSTPRWSSRTQAARRSRRRPPTSWPTPPTVGNRPDYVPYPYDPTKAKQMLAPAGVSNLTLKFLYRRASVVLSKNVQTLQADAGPVRGPRGSGGGHSVGLLLQVSLKPAPAKSGYWDFAIAGWDSRLVLGRGEDLLHSTVYRHDPSRRVTSACSMIPSWAR